MKTKTFAILIAFFIVTGVFSQNNLNEYKYVLVPRQFAFLKEPDQYKLNGLSKFLFNKYGFSAFMEGEKYPKDYFDNRCAALRADVLKEPGMFKTKLKVVLKDCNDQVVYMSPIGESREKDFSKSYNEAVRKAFKVFETLNYVYSPSAAKAIGETEASNSSVVDSNEIQKLKQEIEALKNENKKEELKEEIEVEVSEVKKVVLKEDVAKSSEIRNESIKKVFGVLYAQEIENGYQLVDSSPKVVYKIKKTGLSNVYLVEGENAIIYKKSNVWIVEHYQNAELKNKQLNIKF